MGVWPTIKSERFFSFFLTTWINHLQARVEFSAGYETNWYYTNTSISAKKRLKKDNQQQDELRLWSMFLSNKQRHQSCFIHRGRQSQLKPVNSSKEWFSVFSWVGTQVKSRTMLPLRVNDTLRPRSPSESSCLDGQLDFKNTAASPDDFKTFGALTDKVSSLECWGKCVLTLILMRPSLSFNTLRVKIVFL